MSVYFPKKSHHGYFDKGLRRHFNTKREKEQFMKANKLVEDGSMESDRHRIKRCVEEINASRESRGLKPLSKERIVGDSMST